MKIELITKNKNHQITHKIKNNLKLEFAQMSKNNNAYILKMFRINNNSGL